MTTTSASPVTNPLRPAQQRATVAEMLKRALVIAALGSLVIGALEAAAGIVLVSRALRGEAVPLRLMVAAVGQNALSHLMLWLPVLLVLGWVVSVTVRRRGAGSAVLAGLFALLAGAAVFVGDVVLRGNTSVAVLLAGSGGVVICAVVAGGIAWGLERWLGRGARRWCGRVATAGSLLLIAATGLAFLQSPLFDAGAWRAGAPAGLHASVDRPHVLWIVADTARADGVTGAVDGQPIMPFVRRLSQQAITCDLAIGNGMWTVPSHASMLTGLPARQHGTGHTHLHLDDEFETIAEILSENGYDTALVSGNPFVSHSTNMTQGFAEVQVTYHLRRLEYFSLDFLHEQLGWTPFLPWFDGDFGGAIALDGIQRWLDRNPSGPKFLFVNFMEGHTPYRAPLPYRRMFMDDEQVARSYALRTRAHGNIVQRLDIDYNLEGPHVIPAADQEVLRRQYYAALRYVDDRIAELIGMFATRGLLDETLVVITSDHGEHLGQHEMWSHRFLTYQDLAHVAMIVRPPGTFTPRHVRQPTQLADLFTTVHAAALPAGELPERPHTRNLLDAAADEEARVAICEYKGPAPVTLKLFAGRTEPELLHRKTPQIAAVGERYKLMASASGRKELFDLHVDPTEQHNLLDELPDEVERLSQAIELWRERTPAYGLGEENLEGIPPETLRALKALGYISDD